MLIADEEVLVPDPSVIVVYLFDISEIGVR